MENRDGKIRYRDYPGTSRNEKITDQKRAGKGKIEIHILLGTGQKLEGGGGGGGGGIDI